jgi:hypothetical protein
MPCKSISTDSLHVSTVGLFLVKHLILAIRYHLRCKANLRKAPKLIAGCVFF